MKYTSVLLAALLFMSFTPKEKNYKIKGDAKNVKEGEMIYLKVLDPNTRQFISIDSTAIQKENFEFNGNAELPTYGLLTLSPEATDIIVLEKGNINVKFDSNDFTKTSITGTKNNDDLNAFYSKVKHYQKEASNYKEENQEILTSAIKDNDSVVLNKLSQEFSGFVEKLNNVITNQVTSNPNSFTSAIVIHQRLENENIDTKEAGYYYNNFSEDIKSSNLGLAIKRILDNQKETNIEIGSVVPNVEGKNENDQKISLQDNLGKVTILHFWAPWCPSCHESLPRVKELNTKYHKRGLNVFSVALTEDMDEWKETIATENLAWSHIIDTMDIATQFGVRTIPTVFVLDQNGVVLDINHLDNNLDPLIEEQLNN